jgi:hypothetical protein
MDITLEFWEKGSARIVHSYLIMTDLSGVENHDEKFIASIRPASSNFPAGEGFDPVWGSSHVEAKNRAVAAIRARPENAGLRSFEKMA